MLKGVLLAFLYFHLPCFHLHKPNFPGKKNYTNPIKFTQLSWPKINKIPSIFLTIKLKIKKENVFTIFSLFKKQRTIKLLVDFRHGRTKKEKNHETIQLEAYVFNGMKEGRRNCGLEEKTIEIRIYVAYYELRRKKKLGRLECRSRLLWVYYY